MTLLDDIHALARIYGWTEPECLALRCQRRDAYLARIEKEQDAEFMSSILGAL